MAKNTPSRKKSPIKKRIVSPKKNSQVVLCGRKKFLVEKTPGKKNTFVVHSV